MKIATHKKALLPYIDYSLPKENAANVTIHADDYIYLVVSSSDFTFRTRIEGEILETGEAHFSLAEFRRSIDASKAKFLLYITETGCEQPEDQTHKTITPIEKVIPPLQVDSLFYTSIPDALSHHVNTLSLFTQKDGLYEWRDRIFFQKNEKGICFTQTNGIHLVEVNLNLSLKGTTELHGSIPSYIMRVLCFYLPMMKDVRLTEGDFILGFMNERSQLVFRYHNIPSINVSVPSYSSYAKFHLNPIGKKSFEKVLMEELRKYRDQHLLEYPEIHLSFKVEKNPEKPDFRVIAYLSHKDQPEIEIVSTTSPFFAGEIPYLFIPAYDFAKALSEMNEVTSLSLTDRGVLLEYVEMNMANLFDDQETFILHTTIFLHGRKPVDINKRAS